MTAAITYDTAHEGYGREYRRHTKRERRISGYRRREARLKNMILVLLIILAACFFALFMTATKTEAHKMSEPSYKYYTSITVDSGDTLWSIAEEYMTDEYRNIDEYMSEVASINHLRSDQLKRGQTLCIPYYSSEYKN